MRRLLIVAAVATACGARSPKVAPSRPLSATEPPLAAPALIAPPDGVVLTNFPRTATLEWSPVPGAVQYRVHVDCFDCCRTGAWCSDVLPSMPIAASATTRHEATVPGDNRARWRVWAVDRQSQEGSKSEWRHLSFDTRANRGPLPMLPGAVRDPNTGQPYPPGSITLPKPLSTPNARYTDAARRARVSGLVMLSVVIGVDGRVERADVTQSLQPDLDASAIEAVKGWRFEPAIKDGQPVPVLFVVTMTFDIK
jgi:TonB family protein